MTIIDYFFLNESLQDGYTGYTENAAYKLFYFKYTSSIINKRLDCSFLCFSLDGSKIIKKFWKKLLPIFLVFITSYLFITDWYVWYWSCGKLHC